MNKLIHELQRMYFLERQPWQTLDFADSNSPLHAAEGAFSPELLSKCLDSENAIALQLVSSEGLVRAMVVGFEKASDWAQVAKLYQGVQEDLELPAPAIAVSGRAGFQFWLSLDDCVPALEASYFLDGLRLKYLGDLSSSSLRFIPDAANSMVTLVPAFHEETGKWSAFIDPSMGAMFIEESGLDMAPNMDRQADMLSGLKRIKTADFQRVLGIFRSEAERALSLQEALAAEQRETVHDSSAAGQVCTKLSVGNHFSDPKAFLLAVMNDGAASANQRIEAAKALLPYFHCAEH